MPKQKDSSTNNDDKPAFEDAALGFVYKSLISRDPNKRRIKPVESILSYDLNLDDSESDDSDFKPSDAIEDDDVETDDEAEKGDDKKANKKKLTNESEQNGNDADSSLDDSDDDDDSSSDEDEEEDEIDQFNKDFLTNASLPKSEQLQNNSSHLTSNGVNAEVKLDPIQQQEARINYLKKLLVCSVCLGEDSRNDDEIVECDSCGISVHELCYGITADDAESIHSDASSASTEPWFCDPCKAGIKNPLCELCPNSGGIFKITDAGRWVHMVCSLYVAEVTFADVERYRGPSLANIGFNKWGSKSCSLCEDERYSLTGVCVSCDAGMCKTYFHVTCAQREGLLCARAHDEVDPHIVHCKLHSDRNAAKIKRRNYLALVAKHRLLANTKNQQNSLSIEDCITNQRTLSKLFSQRKKFTKNFPELEHPTNSNLKKIPKLLDSSPSALRRLINKGDLLGLNTSNIRGALSLEDLADIRRKWHIQPAFSLEFISYYLDRNDRMLSLEKQKHELKIKNLHLKEVEKQSRIKYDQMFALNENVKSENEAIRAKIRKYLAVLGSFAKSSQDHKTEPNKSEDEMQRIQHLKLGRTILNLPEMQAAQARNLDSTSHTSHSSKPLSSKSINSKEDGHRAINIKVCATCTQTRDQHSLALCDSCHLYYHLYCLDPPLKRMPKKNRFGGWQCSNCTEKEQEESEQNEQNLMEVDSAANSTASPANDPSTVTESSSRSARKLRENPKTTLKYEEEVNTMAILSAVGISASGSASNSRGRPRARTSGTPNSSNKRGRKPRGGSSTSGTTPSATLQQTQSTRKRKLSSSLDANPPVTTETTSTAQSPSRTNISTNTGTTSTSTSASAPTQALTPSILAANESATVVQSKLAASTSSGHTPSKKPAPIELCNGCKEEAQMKQSVRCDTCQCLYHFACLEPPCTKSPKRRGYTWCCFVCEKKDGEKRDHSHSHSTSESEKTTSSKMSTSDKSDTSHIKTESVQPEKPVERVIGNKAELMQVSESETKNSNCADSAVPAKVDATKGGDRTMANDLQINRNNEVKTSEMTNNTKDAKTEKSLTVENNKNGPVAKEASKEGNIKMQAEKVHQAEDDDDEVLLIDSAKERNDIPHSEKNHISKNGDPQSQSEVKLDKVLTQ